jgi:hypothetical protein
MTPMTQLLVFAGAFQLLPLIPFQNKLNEEDQ